MAKAMKSPPGKIEGGKAQDAAAEASGGSREALIRAATIRFGEEGFAVRRNGAGVLVDVRPGEKAAPVHVLTRNAIPVSDFEVE